MVPSTVTVAVLEDELARARQWAATSGWQLAFDEATLMLECARMHPADGLPLLLRGGCDEYTT